MRARMYASFCAAVLVGSRPVPAQPAPGQPAPAADYVWWEGEDAAAHTLPKNDPFGAKNLGENAKLLSGGQWLNATGKGSGAAPTAEWAVDVPADGEYALWVRKFWKHGPFRWRFDSMPAGEWRELGTNPPLADDTPLKKHVNANWVSLGPVTLPAGKRAFQVEIVTQPGKDWGAGFDCFVLARGPFVPNGKTKPGAKVGAADEGFFPFEPDTDTFRPDALLDLRSLNEPAAGRSGFLKRAGKAITLGDGTPTRFWAVNVSLANAQQDQASVDYLARKLAKLGVNMVRFHSPLWDDADVTRLDPKKLDALFYLVSALKKQGIYTALSFYFPVWADGQKLGLEGYETTENKRPFAALYFNPKLQQLYRDWCKQLLTTPNPHAGGLPLARDPAVGLVEIVNEDSLFFWTFGKKNIPPAQWARLEGQFGAWLARDQGSVAEAQRNWNREHDAGDAADRAALYEAFHMTGKGLEGASAGKRKRVGDQVRFLAELQRNLYAAMTKYLKADLQFGGLVTASNWQAADPALLNAVERWTYAASDVIDAHGYFNAPHQGDGADYSVRAGHTFADRAAVRSPEALPLRFQQVADHPQVISELGFPQPNRYRADGVFLSAAYGGLQGVDAMCLFAVGSNYLRDAAIQKFQVASPAVVGSFPAAAVAYRRGDVAEPPPAVLQVVPPADMFALRGGGGWAQDALDPFRGKDVPPGTTLGGRVDGIDPLAAYVGPVVRSFAADASKGARHDLSTHLNPQAKTITSLGGELRWDYGRGLAVMDTPRAQGAAGFLKQAGVVATANAKVALANDFGTVTVVSLDGRPIADSGRVLVQVMTQEQPTGFREAGGVIKDLGSAPFGVRKIAGTVELTFAGGGPAGDGAAKVTAVDPNGYATPAKVTATPAGAGGVRIELLPDVLYYVVGR